MITWHDNRRCQKISRGRLTTVKTAYVDSDGDLNPGATVATIRSTDLGGDPVIVRPARARYATRILFQWFGGWPRENQGRLDNTPP